MSNKLIKLIKFMTVQKTMQSIQYKLTARVDSVFLIFIALLDVSLVIKP